MNIWDIVILCIVAAGVILAVRSMKKKKSGCGCGCSGCSDTSCSRRQE